MRKQIALFVIALVLAIGLAGCQQPGEPGTVAVRPDNVTINLASGVFTVDLTATVTDEEGNVVKHQVSRRANKCYTDTPAPELLQDRDVKPVAGELEPPRLGRPASSEQLLESHHGLDSIFMRELTAFGRTGCAACVETVACGLWIYRDYIDWRSRVIIKGARVKCDNRRRCIIFLRLHELIGE